MKLDKRDVLVNVARKEINAMRNRREQTVKRRSEGARGEVGTKGDEGDGGPVGAQGEKGNVGSRGRGVISYYSH